MGKKKSRYRESFQEWSVKVPQKWWDMLNVPLSYIPIVVGVVGFVLWARNANPPIPLWIVIVIPFGAILFGIVSFFAFHRVRLERDIAKEEEKPQKNFSVDWVNGDRDSYWLREPNGKSTYDAKYEDDATALILDAVLVINTPQTIQVESLALDIAGKTVPSDWESETIYKPAQVNVCFDIPKETPRGERTVSLKAIIDGQEYTFGPFLKNLPGIKK